MPKIFSICIFFVFPGFLSAQAPEHILLNGTWDFEQTATAFPPAKFTRTIPVPGLIHLARPKIDAYDAFFRKPVTVEGSEQYDYRKLDYPPRYSWYRKKILIPGAYKGKEAVLTIKKSQYLTQVFVNGMDAGTSIACYTPSDFHITPYLKFGQVNEILIRVGERIWLPPQAAGSTDKEKEHYLPGIWDDVYLNWSGPCRIDRLLVLPHLAGKKATVRLKIRNFNPSQIFYGDPMYDSVLIKVKIAETRTGRTVSEEKAVMVTKRDNQTVADVVMKIPEPHPWSPDDPFLYSATVSLQLPQGGTCDSTSVRFGMRDFERRGKFFYLNGQKIILRGTNITLHRFFEDPECSKLPWDTAWVRRLLMEIPHELAWNAMRICVGIAPSFWYDIADEAGLLLQNEWLYWQNHGWDEQIRNEYTDWVWTDGNHPSIVIWDAINENHDNYIGNQLIPELKKLDPTRLWDAGYMTSSEMAEDEMDEPHPYRAGWDLMVSENAAEYFRKNPYPLGKLSIWYPDLMQVMESGSAQLVNEYGWIWLWRDGRPSKLTLTAYNALLGTNATADERRELQAYWLQLETEWLRSQRFLAGVLAFCYLTNNYGYTGDWFIDHIADLKKGPALYWFRHCFAPTAVFIDLPDERYLPAGNPHAPGSSLTFNLVGVNDLAHSVSGKVVLELIDHEGNNISSHIYHLTIPAWLSTLQPIKLDLPTRPGGYLIKATFNPDNQNGESVISRRYIRIGKDGDSFSFLSTLYPPEKQ